MKRIFIILTLIVLTAGTTSARVFVGGMCGFNVASENNNNLADGSVSNDYFFFKPEVGYSFNKYFSLGTQLGYEHNFPAKDTHFTVSPYFRFAPFQLSHFGMFLDASYEYEYRRQIQNVYDVNGEASQQLVSHSYNRVSLSAGISVPVTDRFGITMRIVSYGLNLNTQSTIKGFTFLNSDKISLYWYL